MGDDANAAPQRIQRKRTKGWRLPEGAVIVSRPTLWGNPFTCDEPALAVEAYRRHCQGGTQRFEMGPGKLQFAKNAHPNTLHWAWSEWMRKNLHLLRGKSLCCFCPLPEPGQPDHCHAAVLLKISNS